MKGLRLTEEEFARIRARRDQVVEDHMAAVERLALPTDLSVPRVMQGLPHLRNDPFPAAGAVAADVKPTPMQRMQALGRLPKGTMNKTETAYAAYLDAQRNLGHVLWFRFEGIKLRLADSTFYDTDFVVMVASGQLEIHEVKGFMTDDANVKLKVAASQYPFVFRLIRKGKGGAWDIREV